VSKEKNESSNSGEVKESEPRKRRKVGGHTSSAPAPAAAPEPAATPSKKTKAFTSHDFEHLAENEHARYLTNSRKIGHAVITTEQGHKIARQFAIPSGEAGGDSPKVRPLINIKEIEPFRGMQRYRAETPEGHTPMYAKRVIDGVIGVDDEEEALQMAMFSPTDKKSGEEPFWGSIKPTPILRDDLPKNVQKDLQKELSEMAKKTKGGEPLVVHHESVPQRDLIKTRTPDQNTVMQESARDAYENFFDSMSDELHPELKKRLQRAFTADIKAGLFKNSFRPEWLHAYGWSLMPMDKNPQIPGNLGAAPKWANTQMMILERIVKWFALNSPESLLSIKPKFEMLLDSELIQHIDFDVKLQIKNKYVQLMQKIDPFLSYPLFPKSSDIAQGTAITHHLLTGVGPISEQQVSQIGDTTMPKVTLPVEKTEKKATPNLEKKIKEKPATTSKKAQAEAGPAEDMPLAATAPAPKPNKKARPNPIHAIKDSHEKSSVQILTTSSTADYDTPWRGPEEGYCTGSGVIISHAGKKYILTNAHVVEDSIYLQVRRANDRKRKYEAKRVCVSYQADLALLEVDDPEFNDIAEPAELGEMVTLQQKVMTVGFPMGGTEISVSKGIASRVEVRDYCMSGLDMLQVQIDAAVNPGNSGGAVFSGGKVVGIAFQGYDRQGLGYMIPMPIIQHFLKETFSGKPYRGFPVIPFYTEQLENDDEREYYKLGKLTGVRIKKIDNLCDAFHKLQPEDILLAIDSYPITNEGTIDIPGIGSCIDFIHATHSKFIGDSIALKILRNNPSTNTAETLDIDVILDCVPGDTEKVGFAENDKMPTYYINSGICFIPLTRNYMNGAGCEFGELQLLDEGCSVADAPKKSPDEQIVVVSHILMSKTTTGYDKHTNEIVKEINGKVIKNLRDAISALESNQSPKHVISLASKSKIIVQNMSPAELQMLLKRNHIHKPCSDDLLPSAPSPQIASVPAIAAAPSQQQEDTVKADSLVVAMSDDDSEWTASRPKKAKLSQKRKHAISDDEGEDDAEEVDTEASLRKLFASKQTPGQKRFEATIAAMEQHYSSIPQDDDDEEDDLDFDDEEEEESEDEDDSSASVKSDEAEESEEASEEKAAPAEVPASKCAASSSHRFFSSMQTRGSRLMQSKLPFKRQP